MFSSEFSITILFLFSTMGISILAQKNTDIIPGKYEGGLKVWECRIDLCNYLMEQIHVFHENEKQKEVKTTTAVEDFSSSTSTSIGMLHCVGDNDV
jgi:hypothetical protein